MTDTTRTYDLALKGLGLPKDRKPQERGSVSLSPDTVVVSADNHWSPANDIFYDHFPARLKDRAPRIVLDDEGVTRWVVDGNYVFPPHVQLISSAYETIPGSTNVEARMRDLDVEGVDMEIVFGNSIGALYHYPDLEIRELVFRIYNEQIAEEGRKSNGRFHGVGLVNYWDPSKTRASIDEMKAIGLKTFLVPISPKGANGAPINSCTSEMDPFWSAVEEGGLPACYHIGEFFRDGPGGLGTTIMGNTSPFRTTIGELFFGGIFDRHPGLRIAFIEAEMNWVPGALQTASMVYECYGTLLDPKIKRHPREYWHDHC
jgi:predicted TIM-barrel fold metal-dependent hydrolase